MIHDHTVFAFAYAVDMDAWHEANRQYRMTEHNHYPYPICARTCLRGVREWCKRKGYDPRQVQYVFDGGSQDAGHLIELLKRDIDPELRKLRPVPADSAEVRPIQAADYFAWEMRRQMLKDRDPAPKDAYPTLQRLLRLPAEAGIWDLDALLRFCKAGRVPAREA